ncbi:hypothetical protein KAR91_63015 [Candidatus Pacearchaeota archaeon]|nr:hypothetical protein [Candidatus Pacearchaeota archaeon]
MKDFDDFFEWIMGMNRYGRAFVIFLVLILVGQCACPNEEGDEVAARPEPVKLSSEELMFQDIDAVLANTNIPSDTLGIGAIITGFGVVELVNENHQTLTNVMFALNLNYYYFLEEMAPGVKYKISSHDFMHEPGVLYNRKEMKALWLNLMCDQGIYSGRWTDAGEGQRAPARLSPRE